PNAFSSRFIRPRPAEWGWDYRSASRSSRRTGDDYGRVRMCPAAPCFSSPCRCPKRRPQPAARMSAMSLRLLRHESQDGIDDHLAMLRTQPRMRGIPPESGAEGGAIADTMEAKRADHEVQIDR